MDAILSTIRYFFLSPLSNKVAARRCSVGHGILSFLLGLVLLFVALMAGDAVAFGTQYKNAEMFRSFLYHAVDNGLTLTIEDGRATALNGGEETRIDTFQSDSDFVTNGYQLIVDTHQEATDYNDFSVEYLRDGEPITASEWKALTEQGDTQCAMKFSYSPDAVDITAQKAQAYADWLLGEECTDADAQQNCRVLLNPDGTVSEENYNALYELYVLTRYPGVADTERYGNVPTMRSYYFRTYLTADDHGEPRYKNFVLLLRSIYYVSFTTEDGIPVTTCGYFRDVPNMSVQTAADVDVLLQAMHRGARSVTAVNYFVFMVRVAMFGVIAWLAVALIASLAAWAAGVKERCGYGTALCSMASFWLLGAVPGALAAFLGSFFLSRTVCFWVAAGIFLALPVLRCLEQNAYEIIQYKRQTKHQNNL